MVGGERPLLRKNMAETDPPLQKRQFPINIGLYRLSRITPSKKVQLTRIGSPQRAFQWDYRLISVHCP